MFKKISLLSDNSKDISSAFRDSSAAILLGLILLLALGLRFYDLGTESYWIDEMSTVVEGQQNILQLITSGRLDQPPAYYFPFHLWVQLFGTSEVSTRSFSSLIGVCSIFFIYLIGWKLFGKTIGLLSAFLMAISEFQVYYSQQARFYSFFEFATLISFLYFIFALEKKRKIDFALYSIASIFMIYSHAYGLFILAAQAIFLILQWKNNRDVIAVWFISQLIIFLAVIPYFYPLFFGNGGVGGAVGTNIGGLTAPLLRDPLRSIYRFIMSARGERTWGVMLINYSIAAMLLVVGTLAFAAQQSKDKFFAAVPKVFSNLQEIPNVKDKLLLVGLWLLCPIMLPFIFSMIIGPMYLDRYTISAAPAFYLLLALSIFGVRKVVPIIISLGVLVIMIAPSLGYYYVTDFHEQWKEAALYVEENSNPNDVIVFAPNQGIGIQQKTFDWYYQDNLQSCGLGSELIETDEISKALGQCISSHDRFWVVIRDRPDKSSSSYRYTAFFLDPNQREMNLISENHFVEISVYLFEISK